MGTPCAFCAEDIETDATQCKHCGEYQGERDHSATSGKRGLLIALAVVLGVVGLCLPAAGALLFTGMRVAPSPPVQVLPPQVIALRAPIPYPPSAAKFGDHRYVYYPREGVTWEDAKERVAKLSGTLAEIDSPEEQRFLTSLLKDRGAESAWIGVEGAEILHATLGAETLSLNVNGFIGEWQEVK